jgi:hypothetical protein
MAPEEHQSHPVLDRSELGFVPLWRDAQKAEKKMGRGNRARAKSAQRIQFAISSALGLNHATRSPFPAPETRIMPEKSRSQSNRELIDPGTLI